LKDAVPLPFAIEEVWSVPPLRLQVAIAELEFAKVKDLAFNVPSLAMPLPIFSMPAPESPT
jgi:hypothetical protein